MYEKLFPDPLGELTALSQATGLGGAPRGGQREKRMGKGVEAGGQTR